MKTLLLGLTLLSSFSSFATEKNCMNNGTETFCEGDRVFYPFAKNIDQYKGTIISVEEPTTSNRFGKRIIKLDDGTLLTYQSGGKSSNRPIEELKECSVFNDKKVCVGDIIAAYVKDYGYTSNFKVMYISTYYYETSDTIYGVVDDGKNIPTSSTQILLTEGPLPGFDGVNIGDTIPNAYGSVDVIKYYNPSNVSWENPYIVLQGEDNRLHSGKKEYMKFRLSGEKSIKVTHSMKGSENIKSYSYEKAVEKLAWRASLMLEKKCEDMYFSWDTAEVVDIEATVTNLTKDTRWSDTHGGGHGPVLRLPTLNPNYDITGDVTVTGTCQKKGF